MTSLSTRFLGQPRLTKPTLAGAVGPEVTDMFFFTGTGTMTIMISRKQIYIILASGIVLPIPAGRRGSGSTEPLPTIVEVRK
jgi:hypothetical protein